MRAAADESFAARYLSFRAPRRARNAALALYARRHDWRSRCACRLFLAATPAEFFLDDRYRIPPRDKNGDAAFGRSRRRAINASSPAKGQRRSEASCRRSTPSPAGRAKGTPRLLPALADGRRRAILSGRFLRCHRPLELSREAPLLASGPSPRRADAF